MVRYEIVKKLDSNGAVTVAEKTHNRCTLVSTFYSLRNLNFYNGNLTFFAPKTIQN